MLQIDQLIQQIHASAGWPAEATPAPGPAAGSSAGGQPPQGQGGQPQQNPPSQQDIQAAKDLLTQEHQAAANVIARLTTFAAAVKQAAGNPKALTDAQSQFTAIEAVLPARSRGFTGGTPIGLTQGILARIDAYQAATTRLDAATSQVKAELGH